MRKLSSTFLHLRIPFSYFLLPIFLFSLAISPNITIGSLGWTFFIVHFLLYPASNGYNSYFDKDEQSIGVLKNPPPVNTSLYYVSLTLDALAVILGFVKISLTFAVMLLIYGLVSKAYSHPSIRLKKYAVTSWLITGIFQGLFTFLMCYVGVNRFDFDVALRPVVLYAGVLTTVMLWANYPMTQIYQHEEDARHGDQTISMLLGKRGTFMFTAALFTLVAPGFFMYLSLWFSLHYAFLFLIALTPVVLFFAWWFYAAIRDPSKADYSRTMWLNFISATCLNIFFIYLFLNSTRILDAL
jgi:1,4-dihydroxy-2-naphthoate octaprenyltransferase